MRQVLVALLTTPPEGYQPLLSSAASALGKWLSYQSEEGVVLRNELIEAYNSLIKVVIIFIYTRLWRDFNILINIDSSTHH